jgi:hypothetical protein
MATRTITIPSPTDQTTSPSHAATHAGHAGGWLGYNERTTDHAGFGATEADVASLTLIVAVPANRRVRVMAYARVDSSAGADQRSLLRIYEDAVVVQISSAYSPGSTSAGQIVHNPSRTLTPSTGSHTYKVTAQRSGGSGTVNVIASADSPAYLLVEDIGPAS